MNKNKAIVPFASEDQFIELWSLRRFTLASFSGLIINHSAIITNGNITNAVGKPTLNQVKKSISRAETASPFGGDPTAVPFPPMLAE